MQGRGGGGERREKRREDGLSSGHRSVGGRSAGSALLEHTAYALHDYRNASTQNNSAHHRRTHVRTPVLGSVGGRIARGTTRHVEY